MFLLGTIVFGLILIFFAGQLSKLPRRKMLIALLIYVFIVQIIWICALGLISYAYQDTRSLIDAATFLLKGDVGKFDPAYCPQGTVDSSCIARHIPSPHRYMSYYPFQSGPLLWFVLVFALFGINNLIAFQIVNVIAITGLVAILWRLGSHLKLKNTGFAAYSLLVATCVPLLMFCAFVYPNAVGFAITVAGIGIIAEAVRMEKTWKSLLTLAIGFAISGIGIVFKSTFQIIILAAIAAMVITVLYNHRFWQLGASIIFAAGSFGISKLPTVIVEHWTGQNFGKGLPMISWIAIGLGEKEDRGAGWWTGFALRAFKETNNNYDAQVHISRDFIHQRIEQFTSHPDDGLRFFTAKLSSEWAEPTFMTGLYSKQGTSWLGFHGLANFILTGTGTPYVIAFENISQTVVYLFSIIGCAAFMRSHVRDLTQGARFAQNRFVQSKTTENNSSLIQQRSSSEVFTQSVLSISFIGGFLCFTLWEAKGIYTLPFYILLFPIAARGIESCIDWVSKDKIPEKIKISEHE
ncbi:hypothetical protein [Alloscardovia theropitheci]|nr:hypothetical protein [Alloscardovia theropitheci]